MIAGSPRVRAQPDGVQRQVYLALSACTPCRHPYGAENLNEYTTTGKNRKMPPGPFVRPRPNSQPFSLRKLRGPLTLDYNDAVECPTSFMNLAAPFFPPLPR